MRARVKLSPWWTGSVKHRFEQQFIGDYFKNPDIELVDSDDYDFLAVFGTLKEDENLHVNSDRVLVFAMEPDWSPNACINAHEYSDRVFVPDGNTYIRDKNDHIKSDSYIETPMYMLYGGNGDMHAEPKWNWSINSLIGSDNPTTKNLSIVQRNQECSWITGQEERDILYKKRCDLANHLLSSDIDIDIYGEYWEADNNKIKGSAWNKKLGLVDYKFSVAIENCVRKNYYTEKFWDCILTQTVPVYHGCPNLSEFIPEDCYIQLPELADTQACSYVIKERCTTENYNKMLDNINRLRYSFFSEHTYNIWHKIQHEIYNT